ncbi:MAG: hypothetical protein U0836_08310 [Pirellulales bacterium]
MTGTNRDIWLLPFRACRFANAAARPGNAPANRGADTPQAEGSEEQRQDIVGVASPSNPERLGDADDNAANRAQQAGDEVANLAPRERGKDSGNRASDRRGHGIDSDEDSCAKLFGRIQEHADLGVDRTGNPAEESSDEGSNWNCNEAESRSVLCHLLRLLA